MLSRRPSRPPELITIPSADGAFRAHVLEISTGIRHAPADLESRLRRIYPRVVVRERTLSGEAPAWYVYRDGGWRSTVAGEWWSEPGMPRVTISAEGWIVAASPTAAGILGIDPAQATEYHFTDFIVPGTLDDNLALFRVVASGEALTATVLVRPASGDTIAIDLHAWRDEDHLVGVFRLAEDVDFAIDEAAVHPPASLVTIPETDVAFRVYGLRALDRMPDPTPDGLALRLRRLYPHASVEAADDRSWVARREPTPSDPATAWWTEPDLPSVRYDAQALILDANAAAVAFLGRPLVGHHWQEFVTPGSTEQVTAMLEILADVGAAESRFRMPRADGTLVEFDSYTTVQGEELVTVMRPAP